MRTIKAKYLRIQNNQVAKNAYLIMQNEFPYIVGRITSFGVHGPQKLRAIYEDMIDKNHGERWRIGYDPKYRCMVTLFGSLEEIDETNLTDNDRINIQQVMEDMLHFYLTQISDGMLDNLQCDYNIVL